MRFIRMREVKNELNKEWERERENSSTRYEGERKAKLWSFYNKNVIAKESIKNCD
jgi:hypothetical protein